MACARAHVDRHLRHNASRSKISVYLNDDPGTGPSYGFYMENNEPAKRIFDAWLAPLREIGARRAQQALFLTSPKCNADGTSRTRASLPLRRPHYRWHQSPYAMNPDERRRWRSGQPRPDSIRQCMKENRCFGTTQSFRLDRRDHRLAVVLSSERKAQGGQQHRNPNPFRYHPCRPQDISRAFTYHGVIGPAMQWLILLDDI
jgi:hypothetical protein